MIKLNEINWYSRLATIIVCFGILPVIIFNIGREYQKAEDYPAINPVIESGITSNEKPVITEAPNASTTEGLSADLATYTNKAGWSFQYPRTWTITEDAGKNGVTVDTGLVVYDAIGDGMKSPLFLLNFQTQKKSDFKTVGTKVGNIEFDAEKNALIDSSDTTDRCLPVTAKLGNPTNISAFLYAASNMSTPAYSTSAIVTNKDYLIIVDMKTYGTIEDVTVRSNVEKGLQDIYSTFNLGAGVNSVVNACAK